MSLADLQSYFNANTALVFFDVIPGADKTKMYKVVAYTNKYVSDLNNEVYSGTGGTLPYRELYSKWDNSAIKLFSGNVSDNMKTYGKNPHSSVATEKANPFQSKFPKGVRVQFALVPLADLAKVGDTLGVVQVWAVAGDAPLKQETPSMTIPIFRAGNDIKLFKKAQNIDCTLHYIATLGDKPVYTVPTAG